MSAEFLASWTFLLLMVIVLLLLWLFCIGVVVSTAAVVVFVTRRASLQGRPTPLGADAHENG